MSSAFSAASELMWVPSPSTRPTPSPPSRVPLRWAACRPPGWPGQRVPLLPPGDVRGDHGLPTGFSAGESSSQPGLPPRPVDCLHLCPRTPRATSWSLSSWDSALPKHSWWLSPATRPEPSLVWASCTPGGPREERPERKSPSVRAVIKSLSDDFRTLGERLHVPEQLGAQVFLEDEDEDPSLTPGLSL